MIVLSDKRPNSCEVLIFGGIEQKHPFKLMAQSAVLNLNLVDVEKSSFSSLPKL
jgi:hypothetical protein